MKVEFSESRLMWTDEQTEKNTKLAGNWISIIKPIPHPQKNQWKSPQNPRTLRL